MSQRRQPGPASFYPLLLPSLPASRLCAPAGRSARLPADELAELLRQIDATADLEAFSDTASKSVQRYAAGGGAVSGFVSWVGTFTRAADSLLCWLCLNRRPRLDCSGEALSARQQDAADRLCQKLLGSAEIVRCVEGSGPGANMN